MSLMRVLLDQNAPVGLRGQLPDRDVFSARQLGLDTLENGAPIAAAEAGGFDVMITADSNIQYQQNLAGRRIALIVPNTNHRDLIRRRIDSVRDAVASATEGAYIALAFDRPPLNRRPWPR